MDSIVSLRKQIDEIDEDIMKKLNKRFDLAIQIGIIKQQEHINVLDSDREQLILQKCSTFSHSPQISDVYKTIMNASKSLQRK